MQLLHLVKLLHSLQFKGHSIQVEELKKYPAKQSVQPIAFLQFLQPKPQGLQS